MATAAVLALAAGLCLGARPPVRVDSRDGERVLGNGLVELRLGADGTLAGLSRAGGQNLLANGGRGYWNGASALATQSHGYVALGGPGRVVRQSGDLAEVAFRHEPHGRWPREVFPFEAHLHYVLRRGESGFYLFTTIAYRPDMQAARFAQFAYNLRLDPRRFTTIAVDDRRRHRSHTPEEEKQAEKVMDATFRLADGRVVTKYDYCHDIELDDYHVYGWASEREGVWLIQPSAEYYPCTPFKRFLSAHQTATTPVIIWQPHCTHAGGAEVVCRRGESWRKLYGPLFFHVNAARGSDALWADARRRHAELAELWPYAWMTHDDFPVERGEVTGRLVFDDAAPARDAHVVLAPIGAHWSADVRGYHFWSRTDADGRFAIPHVRAGTHTLFAAGADQFREFVHRNVVVEAGQTRALGTLTWKPETRGRRIWQIGVADRTTGEFRNGDDYRHWGLWRRFPVQFPRGVRFIIGKSTERADWNFAHWNWHCAEPAWAIEFRMDERPKGSATLTCGIAAALPHDPRRKTHTHRGTTDVRVSVNGREVGRIALPSSGGVGYRSARHSTKYAVAEIPFDAALLRAGRNTIALRHAHSDAYKAGDPMGERGAGPGYVMYDAIRLEIAAPQPARTPPR